ncbi:hypothetical protein [Microcella sp.]|uniref:hypothetical protein n=1 Tax=Microcella sp. TaxID=1913979 RepID=UPI00391AD2AC
MQVNSSTGEILDDGFDDEEWTDVEIDSLPNFFSPARVLNEGNDVRKFSAEDMAHMAAHLEASPILPMLENWRRIDTLDKHAGGRPPVLGDREILLLCFLLRSAGTGFLIRELAKAVAHNLDDSARELLGIDKIKIHNDATLEEERWYYRCRRALVRLLKLIDSHPGKRLMYTQEERRELELQRDPDDQEMRKERAAQFNAAVLQMTFNMQPRWLRRKKWSGVATVDQTALRAVSQSRRRKIVKGKELVVTRKSDGSLVERYVLEPDAGLYPRKDSRILREDAAASEAVELDQVYMLSVTMMSQSESGKEKEHANLVVASSVTAPNKEVGAQVVRGLRHVVSNGISVDVLVGDGAYAAGQAVENYHEPLRQLGIGIATGYKGGGDNQTQFGPKGGHAGAILTEGEFFCCATPKNLLHAARDHNQGLIDEETMLARLEERRQYRLRAKESPAADGSVPMMCPAYGPQATLECPLRAIHPKSSKKLKPVVEDSNLPVAPDKICTQSSVKFDANIGQKYRQKYSYKSEKWETTMKVGRNTVEALNEDFKAKSGTIVDPRMRRMRGLTALYFMTTIALAHFNIQRIAIFLKAQLAKDNALKRGAKPPRKKIVRARDRLRKSGYFSADKYRKDEVDLSFDPPPPLRR